MLQIIWICSVTWKTFKRSVMQKGALLTYHPFKVFMYTNIYIYIYICMYVYTATINAYMAYYQCLLFFETAPPLRISLRARRKNFNWAPLSNEGCLSISAQCVKPYGKNKNNLHISSVKKSIWKCIWKYIISCYKSLFPPIDQISNVQCRRK